jgi:hypothetical protein
MIMEHMDGYDDEDVGNAKSWHGNYWLPKSIDCSSTSANLVDRLITIDLMPHYLKWFSYSVYAFLQTTQASPPIKPCILLGVNIILIYVG